MTPKTLLLPTLLLAPVLARAGAPSHDAALFGNPAPSAVVTRTIDVTPDTHYIRVASGESVTLRAGDQSLGWTFLEAINGTTTRLDLLMPGVAQARDVYVHVEPSEIYRAG
jgi:uncharacterized cupredoxin-like copper-binding protein